LKTIQFFGTDKSGADPGKWIVWLATHLDNASDMQFTILNHDFSVKLHVTFDPN